MAVSAQRHTREPQALLWLMHFCLSLRVTHNTIERRYTFDVS